MALKGKPAMNLNPAPAAPAAAAAPAPAASTALQDHSEDAPWEEGQDGAQAAAQAPAAPAAAPAAPRAGTTVAAPDATGGKSGIGAIAVLQNDGFGDLDEEIGFGSFPIIKLDKNKFVVEEEEVDEFHCVMLQSRDKWIYKADDDNLFYSTDNEHDSAGRTVEERINEWVAAGFKREKIESRKYKEVAVKMLDTKLAGSMALLSVPPASVRRLGGYRAEVGVAHGVTLRQVVTKVLPGAKVQVNPKISFYPWNFKFERMLDENGE